MQKRKETRARGKTIAQEVESNVEAQAFLGDARTTAANFCKISLSRCCKADYKPIAPGRVMGSHSLTLRFECKKCGTVASAQTGKRVRLLLEPTGDESDDEPDAADLDRDDDDGEEEEEGQRRRGRKRSKRRKTNVRPAETVHLVLSCLLTGQMYADYVSTCKALALHPMHHSTFDRYIGYFMPKIERLAEETVALVRYLIVRYGECIDHLVLTNDWFWLTRGHYSHNGSGTICDWKSGGIVAYRHYCQRTDTLSQVQAYEHTSKSMDSKGFAVMLDEVVSWVENEVPDMLDELGMDMEPHLDGVVLDGDASTDRFVVALQAKAGEAATTKYCSEMKVIPCANHAGKNVGKQSETYGKKWHTTCSCPIKKKVDGEEYKAGTREHRGLNTDSHPLQKSWQRSIGAALRTAREYKEKPENAGKSIKDLAIQGVEEAYNHLQNVHDGPGFYTGERRVCRLHEPMKADGITVYESSQYNNCTNFADDMKSYLQTTVINRIDDFVHPILGAINQNASERVGDVALIYREKSADLKATHYIASTSLGIAHCNNVVVAKFRRKLEANGLMPDERIEMFGTMERRLYQLCGVEYTPNQEKLWFQGADVRAKKSERRATVEYKQKRRVERKKLTEARAARRQDAGHTYKGSAGGGASSAAGASKGVVGACLCSQGCLRGCPCQAEDTHCTATCHPHNRKCRNRPSAAAPSATVGGNRDHYFDDAVPSPPRLDYDLLEREVMFHWDGAGWLRGVITAFMGAGGMHVELDEDGEVIVDDEKPNYEVYYEATDDHGEHCLTHQKYNPKRSAPVDSWYLVRE